MPEAKLRAACLLAGRPPMLCWMLEHDLNHLQVILRNMEMGKVAHRRHCESFGEACSEFKRLSGRQPMAWDVSEAQAEGRRRGA